MHAHTPSGARTYEYFDKTGAGLLLINAAAVLQVYVGMQVSSCADNYAYPFPMHLNFF